MKGFFNPFREAAGEDLAETERIARALQGNRRGPADRGILRVFLSLFHSQPFLKSPDMIRWLRDLLDHEDIKPIFQNA